MKTIAALLTVFNRKQQTMNCLKNLYCQEIPEGYSLDVYLTDDGCTDGTAEAIRDTYPQVHIIYGNGSLFWNRGMWTAWNEASKTADYDYYLWLNDDTGLYENALRKLLESSASHNEKCIIIGATESADHSHVTYGGWNSKKLITDIDGKDAPCITFNGNIALIPQYVYKCIGNLDYYYHHSAGDTDYGLTASKKGIGIFQVGALLGACDEHPTLSDWCNPAIPLKKRLQSLYKPTGQPPQELFHLEAKFYGKCTALFHFITTHLHCVFPRIWIKYK